MFRLHPETFWHVQKLEQLYGRLGELAVTRTKTMITLALVISLIFGTGLLQLNFETTSSELWIPQDSLEYQTRSRAEGLFPSKGTQTLIFINTTEVGGNVLDLEIGEEILAFHQLVTQELVVVSEDDGNRRQAFNKSLCIRDARGQECDHWNVFGLFDYNTTKLRQAHASQTFYPVLSALAQQVSLKSFLGGVEINADLEVVKAEAMIISYGVQDSEAGRKWEDLLISKVLEDRPNSSTLKSALKWCTILLEYRL